ncbi:MAG: MerR family transcriptional regulator [Alphaproteobacteria bacterium]|nr:MerR family transcriptional regulator [Alphaproteobacteria bacterium]
MTRGELARAACCNAETIRYYEKSGLLCPPARSARGHRRYGPEDVRRLTLIRRCRELGFPLQAIPDLLALAEGGEAPVCAEIQERLMAQASEVRRRIADLRRIENAIRSLAGDCRPGADACAALQRLASLTPTT